MNFEDYLASIPLLHSWDGGKTWNTGGFDAAALRKVQKIVSKSFSKPRIIETGAGNTTITFLFSDPAEMVSICPEQGLFDRIRQFCSKHQLDLSPWESICDVSQSALPELVKAERRFDLALIDGTHGWPVVMVDFCYLNATLGRGGMLMIDDVHLHSVSELAKLLKEQPGFNLMADMGKTVVFEKLTDDPYLPEWVHQPYIVRRSKG